MKTVNSVSISGSGNAFKTIAIVLALVCFQLCAVSLYTRDTRDTRDTRGNPGGLNQYKIAGLFFKFGPGIGTPGKQVPAKEIAKYKLLVTLKPGDRFSFKRNRKSMENLYKTGLFSDVESQIETVGDNRLNLYYVVKPRYLINLIKIRGAAKVGKDDLRSAIFSLRKNTWYEESNRQAAFGEIRNFLSSRGYFNPRITSGLSVSALSSRKLRSTVDVRFDVKPGGLTAVNKILLTVPNDKLLREIRGYFTHRVYRPYKFQKVIEKVKKKLKKEKYYFPEVRVKENFPNEEKSKVDLEVTVKAGYPYEFRFVGIKNKLALIASIWEKKVFEKWAEKESKARILYYLKNKGYLNAEVSSTIEVKNFVKYITFKVKKNKRYKLGNIRFSGNTTFSDQEMEKIIKTDDSIFDKLFLLRFRSLRVDQEVLRLFYYFNGFPSVDIFMTPHFRDKKVDINFNVKEGARFMVDTILFNGNRTFPAGTLLGLLHTRAGGPFVRQQLNGDTERLKNFYYSRGFDDVKITPEISPGTEKSILLTIDEGQSYRLGNLIIIGAFEHQRKLLLRLFPLKADAYFNRLKIETFRADIENSSIFNQFEIVKIKRDGEIVDLLIKAMPDKSRYYGFGIGGGGAWGEPVRLRGTLEYQQRNIFNGYSTFSGILQLGKFEGDVGGSGVISYDTPYLFRRRVNSELKFWVDNQELPSYDFTRYGLSETIIKKLSTKSYVLTSFSLSGTRLEELDITPTPVDREGDFFYTPALRFSYVRENRNNPF
ncbi:MAG: hypothetical protein GY950_22710, partial [bacterium]|nr:hypothetical protein [bacterium]